MRYSLLYIVTALLALSACTQRQYAFRKKITVDKEIEQASAHGIHKEQPASAAWVASIQPTIPVKQPERPGVLPLQQLAKPKTPPAVQQAFVSAPDDTIRKKYKFDDGRKNQKGKESQQANPNHNTQAILGFVFGVLSVVIFPLFAIPGLILSAKGFDSEYRVLAIIGYVLSALVLFLLLLLIILLLIFIAVLI